MSWGCCKGFSSASMVPGTLVGELLSVSARLECLLGVLEGFLEAIAASYLLWLRGLLWDAISNTKLHYPHVPCLRRFRSTMCS